MCVEQALQYVAGFEKGTDHVHVQGSLPATDAVEQRLQFVGHGGQVVEAEHAAGALDRVRRTEDAIERLGVRLIEVEPDQQEFERRQVFVGFLEEDLEELLHTGSHSGFP